MRVFYLECWTCGEFLESSVIPEHNQVKVYCPFCQKKRRIRSVTVHVAIVTGDN